VKADAVAVVEAGYAVDLPEADWVRQIAEVARAAFPIGVGSSAYVYDLSGPYVDLRHVHSTGEIAFMTADRVVAVAEYLPLEVVRRLHAPTPRVDSANRRLGTPMREIPKRADLESDLERVSTRDYLTVTCGGADCRGVMLTFPLSERCPPVRGQRRAVLTRVGAHLASAYRLRRRFARGERPDTAAAVLTPGGRVEHLGEDLAARRSAGALVDAVRRMESSRGRRGSPEDALAEWRGATRPGSRGHHRCAAPSGDPRLARTHEQGDRL